MKLFFTAILSLGISLSYSQEGNITLFFQSGQQQVGSQGTLQEQLLQLPSDGQFRYGLVTFNELPNLQTRTRLESEGIKLLDYMPKHAYFARIDQGISPSNALGIQGFYNIPLQGKLSEELAKSSFPAHALSSQGLDVNVLLFEGYTREKLENDLAQIEGTIKSFKADYHTAQVLIPKNQLNFLAHISGVQFIEAIDAPGEPENDQARNNHRVSALKKAYTGLSKELDGSGMSVMLQDDGIIGPHIDFEGRITQYVNFNTGDHGDHTGGTIASAGNLDPRYAGMAPGAKMYVYGAAGQGYPGFDSIASHYTKHDIKITSTSYSNGCNAGYTTLARTLDIQTEQMGALSHVFSAGNNGRSDCGYGAGSGWGNITGGHKVAKNVITVANLTYQDQVNGSSSRGPAKDGRIKPDISGVGTNVMSTTNDNNYVRKTGTSMSCPGVAGTLTTLYQAYKELNNGKYPDQELMKGIICNSADDLGRPGVDFEYGYGRINARKAFDVLNNNQYDSGRVANGDSASHTITIPSTAIGCKIMLIWNDPKGATNASPALVNDLDLEVYDVNTTQFLPSIPDHRPNVSSITTPAQPGRDSINNMEQVIIQGPIPGSYSIKVKGSTVPFGPQDYYLVYVYEMNEIVVEYPVGGESFAPGETETIRWSAQNQSQNFIIEYSTDSGMTWNTIGTAPSSRTYYDWQVPNTFSGKTKIRVRNSNGSGESPNVFSILGVTNSLSVFKACPTGIDLQWNTVNNATSYTIYRLGKEYMDSIGTSTTNTFTASGAWYNPYNKYWFSVSANGPDHAKGRRVRAFQSDGQLLNCNMAKDLNLDRFTSEVEYVNSCNGNGKLRIAVMLINSGSTDVVNPDISYKLNNGAVIKESITATIKAGDSLNYKFNSEPLLSLALNNLIVWGTYTNDENPYNDTLGSVVNYIQSEVVGPCFIENFDAFDLCGVSNDCGITTCALKGGWINAANGESDDIDWRAYNQSTATGNTGPALEHTNGSPLGRYIYLESSGSCNYQEAILISPCIDLTIAKAPVLDFWYHAYGNNMGSLRVDVLHNGVWKNDIFSTSGNQGNLWKNAQADLTPFTGGVVQLRFVGVTGNGFYSDLALDDIHVEESPTADFAFANTVNNTVSFGDLSTAATSWIWDFGDGSSLGNTQNPVHTYSKGGIFVVKQIANSECGSDTISKEINVFATSSSELGNELNGWKIYPQPANDFLLIQGPINETNFNVTVWDVAGKVILQSEKIDGNEIKLNTSQWNSGVYSIQIKGSMEVINRQINKL